MGVPSDAAVSRGDIMRRLADLEGQVRALRSARRLPAAAVGSGGIRVKGGQILIQDASGQTTMTLSTAGLTLQGLLTVVGDILADQGGDITARGGRFLAQEQDGTDIFRVTTSPPSIFMRQELVSDLVEAIVEDLLTSPPGQELAAFVLANRVHTGTVSASQSTSSTSFTDLGTVGPTVSNIDISDARKALVIMSCDMVSASTPQMSFTVSGSSSVSASEQRALIFGLGGSPFGITASRVVALTSPQLNAGTHTFRAKYRDLNGNSSTFDNRNLTVLAY